MLHKRPAFPKPSIVRLLQTLEAKGLVRHAPQPGAYYLTSGVATLSSGYHSEPRVVEAAAQPMDELTAKIKWPLALAVFDGDAVVVRYSTIPNSPLSLLHSSLNMRLSLVSRALGRAYLAFCTRDEQAMLLATLEKWDSPKTHLRVTARPCVACWRKRRSGGTRCATPRCGRCRIRWPCRCSTMAEPGGIHRADLVRFDHGGRRGGAPLSRAAA